MTDNPDFITKADLQVLLAALNQDFDKKMVDREAELKKEFDIQANKILSSYSKKIKAAPEADEAEGTTSKGKQTKREMELEELVRKTNESVVELMKRDDEKNSLLKEGQKREALLAHKNTFAETLLKTGFEAKTIDAIYKLQQFDKAFVEDGKGGFNWKVKANGVEVALPLQDAAKHFAKSELGETFLPGRTDGGGTKVSVATNSNKDAGSRPAKVVVDWQAINHDMHGGGDGDTGGFAPPFPTK